MKKFLICLLLLPSLAYAQLSGTLLKQYCAEGAPAPEMGVCWGFIIGVIRTAEGSNLSNRFCLPQNENLETQQIVYVVEKFLNERPEVLHFNPSVLVVGALSNAFPCKK